VKNQKGLTLLEVLAAIVILSLAVLLIVNISEYSSLAQQKDTIESRARVVAEDQLNAMRQHLRTHHTLPSQLSETVTKGGVEFKVVIHPLSNLLSPPVYATTEVLNRQISLQSIVYVNNLVNLLTITVSWGAEV
jgi:prepilin-type N-terminal cleavage/methylation domain-containing protein